MPSVELKEDSNFHLLHSTSHYQLLLNYYDSFFSSNRMQCIKECISAVFFSYSFFGCIESTYVLTEKNLHFCNYIFENICCL